MRQLFLTLVLVMVVFSISGCGDSNLTIDDSTSSKSLKILSKTEIKQALSNPKEYAGSKVEFYAEVFTVEYDEANTYLQAYAYPEELDKNTVIKIENRMSLNEGDYIYVEGLLEGAYEGENAFGAKLVLPKIEATHVENVDYLTAVAPTLKELQGEVSINQQGYIITLHKIELAERETRAYISVTNNTSEEISFYDSEAKLVTNGRQFESEYREYPDIQMEILPGVTSSGIIVFPAINLDISDFKLFFSGFPDYPFEMDLSWDHSNILKLSNKTEPNEVQDVTLEEANDDYPILVKDNQMFIKGIGLGMTSENVQEVLGEPKYHGPDNTEAQFYEKISLYPDIFIGYYDDTVVAIDLKTSSDIEKLVDQDTINKYQADGDDTIYYYSEGNYNLLKVAPLNDGTHHLYLLYADELFLGYVEDGYYKQVD